MNVSLDFDSVWKRVRIATGLKTQTELAQWLGIKQSSVSGAKLRGLWPVEWAIRLAESHNISIDWLLTGKGAPFIDGAHLPDAPIYNKEGNVAFDLIPLVEPTLSAGNGAIVYHEDVVEKYAFRRDWLSKAITGKRNAVLMMVEGDSMEPLICDGDMVMIDQGRKDLRTGKIYAVGIEDVIMIKRVEIVPGQIFLKSDNPIYSNIEVDPAELRVIGQVIWFARELVK